MNVNELAEQIVFGNTLADKLAHAPKLDYETASTPPLTQRAISSPGRPTGLAMNHSHPAAKPPTAHKLHNDSERGRLLHFLANHELLATELMALVLLKFPEAPVPFRKGIVHTLKEEQRHTRMYLARMEQCGVEFGSYPLSGHFWRMVEPMDSPLDFVSRLSLTFEQANLDYSLYFSNAFAQAGDDTTAKLLQQIYEDEIGHVSHGLKWFRKWKSPTKSDFEAWSERLPFPMSPERARGSADFFNRQGREAAGLSPEFIDAVQVYRRSRGRTPDVHWFNPGAEAELSARSGERDVTLVDQLTRDLELLTLFLAKPDDVVLVRQRPSTEFRHQLLDAKIQLPEFVAANEIDQLAERKLHHFSPWAWTPAAHKVAGRLEEQLRISTQPWNESHKAMFRKSFAADLSRELSNTTTNDVIPVAGPDTVGVPVASTRDIESAIKQFADRGVAAAIVKADFGTSGRGQHRIATQGLTSKDLEWIHAIIESGDGGIVEPELNRVLDLSFLWDWPAHETAPRFLGWTRYQVSKGRRYQGTYLGRFLEPSDTEISRFLLSNRCRKLNSVREMLENKLVPELQSRGFRSAFGVDVWLYRDTNNELRIKPLGELNARTTMGHIALRIEKHLAPGAKGFFEILTKAEFDRLPPDQRETVVAFHKEGRWKQGRLILSEPNSKSKLVPVIHVG